MSRDRERKERSAVKGIVKSGRKSVDRFSLSGRKSLKAGGNSEEGKKENKTEEHMALLNDFCVMSAVILVFFSVVYLLDLVRYQWMLIVVAAMGFLLNLSLILTGFLRKSPVITATGAGFCTILTAVSLYILLF